MALRAYKELKVWLDPREHRELKAQLGGKA